MLFFVAPLFQYMQNSKAPLSSSWQSQLSPSKKKDALRRQIVLPGPSLCKWGVSESETYGLHFPGKTLSSSKENLAKGSGGGGQLRHIRALEALLRDTHQHHTPSTCLGGPQICPRQHAGIVGSRYDSLAEVIHVAMRGIFKGCPPNNVGCQ